MSFERSGKHIHSEPHVFNQTVVFNKSPQGPGGNDSPIWMRAPNISMCDPGYAFSFYDDFLDGYVTTQDGWTTAGTGATVAQDESVAGGVILLTSSGTDNQAAILGRTYEEFSVSTGKKLYFEARVKIAELATDDTNVFVGFTQGTLADAVPLLDNAATTVVADDDLIGFVKSDGGTTWDCYTGDGAAAVESTTGPTRTANWVRLGFIADPLRADFYVDDQLVATHVTTLPTTDEEMTLAIAVKCGSANAETMQVDYVRVIQIR